MSPKTHIAALCLTTMLATRVQSQPKVTPLPDKEAIARREERRSFQSFDAWSPRTNINGDVAMVYGIDPTLPARIKTWRDAGYRIHVMTGVAWGEYQDYLFGKWDGKNHEDESQTDKAGSVVGHGVNVPYMSPGESYGRYLTDGVKRALDAGAEAIHLEEPEFWVRSGYEPNFKREWKAFYGDDWIPLDSSPDAQYRASKLKYFLYKRALSQVFTFVKQYGQEHNRQIACYVPTHSLINYANWGIVSPESSLLDVGCDGYIAQVWTGTARTPNMYDGREAERTFETAYLEYSAMQNLVRASGRRVWYLNDPIEDNADHTWTDYRTNWESTLVASLLQPEVWHYEVMPWPNRIFTKPYPVAEPVPGQPRVKEPIAKSYETELQTVINALGNMKQPANTVGWEKAGTRGVGVLVSDTMMFQRGQPTPSDKYLGSFFGQALPLFKRGLPVEPVQIESATTPGFLKAYRVLLLSYEGQKPPTPQFHTALAAWVREGGALVFVDNDKDPYNAVQDWWNKAPNAYKTPREHLFQILDLPADFVGTQHVGKGIVMRENVSPAALTYLSDGSDQLRGMVQRACAQVGVPWQESNAVVLRRGPYVVASGLSESIPNAPIQTVRGRLIDLFNADLTVSREVALTPGKRAYLFDLDRDPQRGPHVVAAACRVRQEVTTRRSLRFLASGIAETNGVVRAVVPRVPKSVIVGGKALLPKDYDYGNGTVRLRFPNTVVEVPVEISW